jgi:hypothetical protein
MQRARALRSDVLDSAGREDRKHRAGKGHKDGGPMLVGRFRIAPEKPQEPKRGDERKHFDDIVGRKCKKRDGLGEEIGFLLRD